MEQATERKFSQKETKEFTNTIEQAWIKVFNASPSIEVSGNIFTINGLDLRPEQFTTTRKTLAGIKDFVIDGWVVYIWQEQSRIPDTPIDIQDALVGERHNFWDALILLIETEAGERARRTLSPWLP